MKWQQRVRVATGLSCWQIMLHLLVVAVLVMGWMSGTLVRVGLGLCVLYGVTVLSMLFLQRHHEARWREVGDVLEELTTTWYFGAAMIVLWLLSVCCKTTCCWRWPVWPFLQGCGGLFAGQREKATQCCV
ncbi:membrane protein [Enterobacter cloacae]|uniref:Membrane protein n=1 Tax=Enterobacter cloacae TaxID=550 RepID=A0A377M6A6_ENTCL|nr:membrane protein [Enterobacter cloacae]